MNLYEVKFRVLHDCECSRCRDRGKWINASYHVEATNEQEAIAAAERQVDFEDEIDRQSISVNDMGEANRLRLNGVPGLPFPEPVKVKEVEV